MANTFKVKTKKDIGTADSAIYTCPGGTATTIIGLNLANKTSSAVTSDITLLNNDGDSCFVVKAAPVPVGGSLIAVVKSSAASSIDVTLSILEIT